MSRGHLSKRLPDSEAIRLFAEHHILHVRRRKNGEILAVKHATFGWISPEQYYGLQKLHDAIPVIQEVVRAGYLLKVGLWSFNPSIGVAGVDVPIPAGAILAGTEIWNFYQELQRVPIDPQMLAYRAFILFGPFGEILQILDTIHAAKGILPTTGPSEKGFTGGPPPFFRPGPQMPPYRRRP